MQQNEEIREPPAKKPKSNLNDFKLIDNKSRIPKCVHNIGIAKLFQHYKGGAFYFDKNSVNTNSNKRGSCITNENDRLVSVGWNTILYKDANIEASETLNAISNSSSLCYKDNTIFLTHFPDNKDAQAIKQSGITKVVYLNNCNTCKKPHTNWRESKCQECKGSISLLIFSNVEIKKYSEFNKSEKGIFKFNLNECLGQGTEKNPENTYQLGNIANIEDLNMWMFITVWTAARSQDIHTKVGACILDKDGKFLSTGYNGFPNDRIKEYFDPVWEEDKRKKKKKKKTQLEEDEDEDILENKHTFVCHAEINAILNNKTNNLNGATIFVTLFPCEDCAKLIILNGIRTVIYLSDHKHEKETFKNSRKLLEEYSKYNKDFVLAKFPLDETNSEFTIDFEEEI